MSKLSSRRRFLKSSLAAGVGGAVALPFWPRTAGAAAPQGPDFCVTLCNHWSYIGIGWQLGIESCVLAVTDAMEMVDREPHVKTCLEMDARCYEFMAEKFPEVAARLAKNLAAGKLELIGGSYAQPMGTTIGGESNIRQIVVGRETIRKALGYDIATMLHEEEFTHPQLPQLSALAGYKYASLAQVDTWGRGGLPAAGLQRHLLERDRRHDDPHGAEERPVRLLDRRREPVAPTGRHSRSSRSSASPWSFAGRSSAGNRRSRRPICPRRPSTWGWPRRAASSSSPSASTSTSTARRPRKPSSFPWTPGTSPAPGDWAATRSASCNARWKGCCWPPRSSTPPPRRWGPSRRPSCWKRRGRA